MSPMLLMNRSWTGRLAGFIWLHLARRLAGAGRDGVPPQSFPVMNCARPRPKLQPASEFVDHDGMGSGGNFPSAKPPV